jgi:Tfp pilus assembly PilM family ATPase
MWYRRPSSVTVGLDIGRSAVRALAMDHAGGVSEIVGWHEERWHPVQRARDESEHPLPEQQEALQRTMDQMRRIVPLHRARIVTAIHGRGVVIKPVEVEPVAPHQVRELLRWETEEHLPFAAEETLFDHVILPQVHAGVLRVLLVAVHRALVTGRRALLDAAGIARAAMTVDALAILNACRFQYPDCAIGQSALLTLGETHLQAVLLTDGVPTALWDTEQPASPPGTEIGALPDATVSGLPLTTYVRSRVVVTVEAAFEAVQRCLELHTDPRSAQRPIVLRGLWLTGDAPVSMPFMTALGERLQCPIHTTSAFATLPIRPQAMGTATTQGDGGRFMVACGLALQGAPITLTEGTQHVTH